MARRVSSPFALLLCCAVLGLSTLSTPSSHGQTKRPPDEPGVRLQPARDFRNEKDLRRLADSPPAELDAKAQELLDSAAQYYAYRLTWTEEQNKTGGMSRLCNDLDFMLQDFQKSARAGVKNDSVLKEFCKQLVVRLKEVMGNPRVIARVNGARCLALVAENGYEDVADVLVELLQDPKQSDGVKYYALVGLKDLFKYAHQLEPVLMKNRTREVNATQAALAMVERKGPATTSKEEIDGFRVLRREAVRALALTRYPALVEGKTKEKKVIARPALTLLRVMAEPKRFTPEPRIDEQVEAAIGLARMQTKLSPEYQPDYAAEHLARFVARFAQRQQAEGKKMTEPWKIDASRLSESLEVMKLEATKNAKDKEAAKYVTEVFNRARPVLDNIEKGQTANPTNLSDWLVRNPSPSKTLFRGAPDTAIKESEPVEPGEKP